MIRKRPTQEFKGLVKLSGGSWNKRRVDADISGSLTQSGDVTARLIVSKEKSDSYLDRYESDSTLISGIVEAKVSDDSKLSIGLSRYEDKNKGSQWGGIPAFNGIDYDVSTNAASDWSYRDVLTNEAFVEFDSNINDNWKVKTTYLYKNIKQDANLINLWDYSGDLKIDGAQDYDLSSKEHLLDLTLNGNYSLFNKEHKAVFGINYAKRNVKENSLYDRNILGTIIDLQSWDGSTATPVFNDTPNNSKYNEKLLALFFATNYNILDDLSLVAGTRYSNWETKGYGYWNSDKSSKNNGILTPYIGLVYKISDNISTYASYTTSYTPQSEIDKNAVKIDPKEGTTYELGIKSKLFDDKLNTAFSVFKTKQDNVAQWAGRLSDGTNRTYYSVDDGVQTKGFEVELSGALSDSIDVSFGYTQLKVEDANGKDTQTYIPRKTLKALLSYKPHFVKNLKLGTAFKYNSKTSINQWYGSAKQGAYSLVDVFANYKINKNLKLSFNVNNITNKKYYGSLIKSYVTYAAPRNIGASIEYKF